MNIEIPTAAPSDVNAQANRTSPHFPDTEVEGLRAKADAGSTQEPKSYGSMSQKKMANQNDPQDDDQESRSSERKSSPAPARVIAPKRQSQEIHS